MMFEHSPHSIGGFFRTWFPILRAWSLTATLIPLLMAPALVSADPAFSWVRWTLALIAAACLHLSVNLLNTWGDDRSGVDTIPGSICTIRPIQTGIVSAQAILYAGILFFGLSILCAAPLFWHHHPDTGRMAFNLPLFVIATLGGLGAINYTTCLTFKYHGLGVPFVFFLMGFLEVLGGITASVPDLWQNGLICNARFWYIFLLSLPIGALVSAIMNGNDMRDITSDTSAGIRTTASLLGIKGSLILLYILYLTPYITALTCLLFLSWGFILSFLALPLTLRTLKMATCAYRANPTHPAWQNLEAQSAFLHLTVGLLWDLTLYLVLRGTL